MMDMPLQCTPTKAWGKSTKTIQMGPFNIQLNTEVYSDVLLPSDQNGFFVKITSKVWLYLVVSAKDTMVYVLDGEKAEITTANVSKFGGLSTAKTLVRLHSRSSLRKWFQYQGDGNWKAVPMKEQGKIKEEK